MKSKGADFSARARIRKLVYEGYSAEEISDTVLVDLECVKGFVELYTPDAEEAQEAKQTEETPAPVAKKKAKKKVAKKAK